MPVRVILAALCVSAMTAGAQDRCAPNELVAWWPQFIQANWSSIPLTPRAAMEANQRAAEVIVKKTAYGTPHGFAPMGIQGYGDPPERGQVWSYHYSVYGYVRCNKYDEHGADISIIFNPRPQQWSEGDRPMPDENGDGLFMERDRAETLFGSFATFSHIHEENTLPFAVLFTAGGESPTIPATREEYLRAQIFSHEGKNGAAIKEASTVRRKQYQEWVDGTATRTKEREQILAIVAASDPSKVAKMRADMEKADTEAGAYLKKLADEEPGNASQMTVYGDRIRAQIAAMTPEERAAPAWVVGFDFVAPGTPSANAIVRINPAFYRARKSATEVRAILVTMPFGRVQDEIREQHLQLYKQFDWSALKRLLAY